jgi:hypothetical protein
MVRRMKSDVVPGGVGRGSRRRGLLLFALLLVVAQVLLFAFLRMRKEGEVARASPSLAEQDQAAERPGASLPSPAAPAPQATPLRSEPEGARTVASAEPGNQPLDGPENRPAEVRTSRDSGGPADSDDDKKDDSAKARAERERRDRADRERDQRERRDRADRERARLEAERDKARLEMDKERARIELERAERARQDAERERARLEAERATLARSQPASKETPEQTEVAPPPARPAGSPDVLVVLVSARVGASSLSREEVRNIYTGRTTFWPNNTPVRAYIRPTGSPAGRKFFRSLLGTSPGAFREHWNELQLSGGGIAPATVTSAESMVARVAGSAGAIGFVLESELPADVSGVRLIRFK